LSQEKLDLGKKVFAYVELNLSKINDKMKTMEVQLKEDEDNGFYQRGSLAGKRTNTNEYYYR
jgi:hypothetical protein